MTISKLTIKLFGNKETVYRVLDKDGEVLQVFSTLEEAKAFAG